MAEESTIFSQWVKHVGFFHFKDLYNFCYDWFKNENYIIEEREYTEKITERGKEVIIKWVAWRKISDYFKFVIEVKWNILGMQDAKVKRGEKEEKTNQGEVKMAVKGILVKDYEQNWEKNPFYKFFRGIYDKYIIRTTIDDYEDRLVEKAVSYLEQVKAFLVLEGRN